MSNPAAVGTMEVVNQVLLRTLEEKEEELNQEIQKLDKLEDNDLQKLREKRLRQLRQAKENEKEWLRLGHGEYTELHDTKEFFSVCKDNPLLIVHFYTPTNQFSLKLDGIFHAIAKEHLETKICKVNAEKVPFLVDKFQIWIIPCLVLCQKGEICRILHGLDDIPRNNPTNPAELTKANVKQYLTEQKLIEYNNYDYEDEEEGSSVKGNMRRIEKRGIRQGEYCDDSD